MSATFWKFGPAALCVLVLTVYALLFHFRAPYFDHWYLISLYEAYEAEQLAWGDLFALHGNHWHASGYAVQLGLSGFTDMAHWAESLASIVIATLGFVALIRMLQYSMDLLSVSYAEAWAFGLSAFLFFSLDQSANWLWGWQVAVFINIAGALWTIERLSVPPITIINTLLAAIAASMAIYGFGTGWALIPVGFALLLLRGALRSTIGCICLMIWSAMTGLLLLHFFLALTAGAASYGAQSLPDLTQFQSWKGLFEYTAHFLASPIVRFARDSAVLTTIFGTGVLFWALLKLHAVDHRAAWRATLPFLAMAAYAFGSGFLTALGRWEAFGIHQAFVSRYITFGTFFWIAIFAITIFAIAKTNHRTHKRTFSVLGLLLVLKIANQPSVIIKQIELSQEIAQSARELASAYPEITAEMYAVLHAPAQRIEPDLEILYAHRVSLFANVPEGPMAEPERGEAR